MDRNALTETRRETVLSLLKGMNIKKDSDGGFDKDDVYNCIQQLCDLYENHIEELENNYEAEISDLTSKYQKYDENNELYVSLILEAKKSSNDIINQAKSEVNDILASCKDQVAEQEAYISNLKQEGEKEKAAIDADLASTRETAETEKAAIIVEMEAEREKLSAVKSKYRQQASVLDGEFAELKTNIMLAAAKLDNLKSQLEEVTGQTDVNWEVSESGNAVDFPNADVAVDNVLDITTDNFATPIVEAATPVETPSEPMFQADDLFEKTFFKSEILENAPKASTSLNDAIEEAMETPAVEEALETAPAAETPIEEITGIPETIVNEAPAIEAAPEVPVEPAQVESTPVEEVVPVIEEIPVVEEIPQVIEQVQVEAPAAVAEESDAEIESLLEEISFDDIDDILNEIDADAATAEETTTTDDADALEEISFDGLEALFKDEQ